MADKLLALVALAMLFGFLGIVVVFVPDPDLMVVSILALGMAAFDFYRYIFKKAGAKENT